MSDQEQTGPRLDFARIERIEHDTPLLMSLMFGKETLAGAERVFHDARVKTAILRLLNHWDEMGGALPSHNFAHAIGTARFAVGSAIDCKAKVDPLFLPYIAIASLYQDSARHYGKSDRVIHRLLGASSYGIKESIALSVKVMESRMMDILSSEEIGIVGAAMSNPRGSLGRFVYTGDTFELSDPFRNSAIAYENSVSRGRGAMWIIKEYNEKMVEKMESLLPDDRAAVTGACWVIGDWAYDFSLRAIKADPSVSGKIGYCAARGIQTLLLESNALHTKVTSMSPALKLHSNKIRRRCMESMVKKSSIELRRLRQSMIEDPHYCGSLAVIEGRGRLNRKVH
jgi:hypothetical protein